MQVYSVFQFFPSDSSCKLLEIFSNARSAEDHIILLKENKDQVDKRYHNYNANYFIMPCEVKD